MVCCLIIIIIICCWIMTISILPYALTMLNKKLYYKRALERSKKTSKPLLVIGDPITGSTRRKRKGSADYGYGNACMDITGCPSAPFGVITYKGKIETILPTLDTNSYVIFISCVLEYVDDIETIVAHLYRVSGGDLFNIACNGSQSSYKDVSGLSFVKKQMVHTLVNSNKISWKK